VKLLSAVATIKEIYYYIISFLHHEWTQKQTGNSDTESMFQHESMQPDATSLQNQAQVVEMPQHNWIQDNMQVMEVADMLLQGIVTGIMVSQSEN
jgi:hypothetical protein